MSSTDAGPAEDTLRAEVRTVFPKWADLSEEDFVWLQSQLLFDEYNNADLVLSAPRSRRWLRLAIGAGMHPDSLVMLDGPATYDRLGLAAMDEDLDQIGQLIYAFGTANICSATGLDSSKSFPRYNVLRHVGTFSALRCLWRFLRPPLSSHFRRQKFSLLFASVQKTQRSVQAIETETGMSSEALDLVLANTLHDGIARVALKEVAIGLAFCNLPVLCTIEIGAWLAATHDEFHDQLARHSAWEVAKSAKHWLNTK